MSEIQGYKNIPPRETYKLVREENRAIANEQMAMIRRNYYQEQTRQAQTQEQKKLDIQA